METHWRNWFIDYAAESSRLLATSLSYRNKQSPLDCPHNRWRGLHFVFVFFALFRLFVFFCPCVLLVRLKHQPYKFNEKIRVRHLQCHHIESSLFQCPHFNLYELLKFIALFLGVHTRSLFLCPRACFIAVICYVLCLLSKLNCGGFAMERVSHRAQLSPTIAWGWTWGMSTSVLVHAAHEVTTKQGPLSLILWITKGYFSILILRLPAHLFVYLSIYPLNVFSQIKKQVITAAISLWRL